MPAFLEEGYEEVDTHQDVLSKLLLAHGFVTNGDVHANCLLQLEFD